MDHILLFVLGYADIRGSLFVVVVLQLTRLDPNQSHIPS